MDIAQLTTLRTGGPAREFVSVSAEDELVQAVRNADAAGKEVLLVAGGSNLVVSDSGFDGLVIHIDTKGITTESDLCGGAFVTVAAGENFDDFVSHAVSNEWIGIEALSGIPGTVGATPIQNVGAYGQEVADTISSVRTWDRKTNSIKTFSNSECEFTYRNSFFKKQSNRFVILAVTFQFKIGSRGTPIAYEQLARQLGVAVGERVPMHEVRDEVLTLRRFKGMVLDEKDHDTWSTGSFFTNPFITAEQSEELPEDAPRFIQEDGSVKTSAAWLIEHAGFTRGFGEGNVTLSNKHTLAITNRGGATTAEILHLASQVRDGVETLFGIRLENEPVLVGCSF